MGWNKILIYSCTFFILTSCCTPVLQKKFYTTEYGSNRPKKNKFKLSKKQNELNDLQLESIYISKNKETFYRFFKNGKVLISGINPNLKEEEQFNNLKSGRIGYYKIKKNLVLFEYFSVGAHDCGEYHQYQKKIIGDSIVGYQKIKVEGLRGTPDW
ncbi:hypothetical protein PG911_12970 [Tenacibaculum ovolyticum]|uniref:hypothetical protein n=1 Tax=Tenacibaculum ovolyticum TaxID=104270 RepID=UPI0007EC53D3|nr:hypothetical protein [Tenacibaculum ovolyticum]WBX75561.1 hypothetical protein PG911_12970 [Tenacibaculum ovolyticum]